MSTNGLNTTFRAPALPALRILGEAPADEILGEGPKGPGEAPAE